MVEQRLDTGDPVTIPAGSVEVAGERGLPPGARGVVAFVDESGSSRRSRRDRFLAHGFHEAGLATLLLDLLTPAEEEHDRLTGELRLDVGFLADRLGDVTEWIRRDPEMRHLPVGYCGASTGAAVAFVAAAESPAAVAAIVSCGGRTDLAGGALERVVAPTLLIVGQEHPRVLDLNTQAFLRLQCEKRLAIVPRATTHLFEEPGTLDEAASVASAWFRHFLGERMAQVDGGARP